MDQDTWNRAINAYCERTDASFWSEPVNAVTNAAFLIAAVIMWGRVRGQGMPLAIFLCAVLFVIGVGSFLFHTFATQWAALADTLPILIFILAYIYVANLHYWRWPWWGALLGMLAFIPYAAALTPAFRALPFFATSAFYWPVPLLILAYAALLFRRYPDTARGLAIGAGILIVSLVFRTLDQPVCGRFPLGTHFMWHLLNAAMLGWMIEVYRRHMGALRAT
jgi:hypothetical protein